MRTLTPVAFAEMAVSGSNDTVIVMDLQNAGGSSRWSQQFPSLDAEQIENIDGVTFLTFVDAMEAIRTFERLTSDCAENDTGGMISGTITIVMTPFGQDDGVEIHEWDLHDDSRPVFTNHRWSHEDIVDRI